MGIDVAMGIDAAQPDDAATTDTVAPHDVAHVRDAAPPVDGAVVTPDAGGHDASSGSDARATRTSNCFSSPGACGYPDPAFGTVGVPPGVVLTPSGSITVTTPGTVIENLDIMGGIDIRASHTTIRNVRITVPVGGSAVFGVTINPFYHGSGTLIEDTTIRGAATTNSPESAVWSGDPSLTLTRVYFYNFADPLEGAATINDSYLNSNGYYTGAHVEDVYIADATLVVNHSVLFNPQGQTATVFVDTNGGSGGAGDSHLTVTNSLLAGGGWCMYPASGATSAGSGTMNVSNNRFARCLTSSVFDSHSGGTACSGGADSHGYWPQGGYYGLAADLFCPPTAGQAWTGNVWDDSDAAIGCP